MAPENRGPIRRPLIALSPSENKIGLGKIAFTSGPHQYVSTAGHVVAENR